MASSPDPLALPAVPPPAPADHPVRDALLAALLIVPLVAAGLGAFVSRDLTTLPFEKRRAHPWPVPVAGQPVRELTSAFERAFDDRFGGREWLARLHHAVEAAVFAASPVPNVLLGRNGWLYFLGEDGRALDQHYRGTLPPDVSVEGVVRELERRHALLAARGIPYLVVVVPDKFSVYAEHLPAWVTRARATPLDRIGEALRADGRVHFVDLRPALLEAKARRQVYYRTDSHWNYAGAAAGYEALMREVQRALPDRIPRIAPVRWPAYVPGVDTHSGDLTAFLGVPRLFREDDPAPLWKVLADAASRCAKSQPVPAHLVGRNVEILECPRAELPVALIGRDSMAIPLAPLIGENFRRTVFVSTREIDWALVDAMRPDIVIDQFVERALTQIPQGAPAR